MAAALDVPEACAAQIKRVRNKLVTQHTVVQCSQLCCAVQCCVYSGMLCGQELARLCLKAGATAVRRRFELQGVCCAVSSLLACS